MSRKYNIKQSVKKSVPQYKLYAFIVKHFNGNVSKAAKHLGIKQPKLAYVINKGTLRQGIIDNIVLCAKKVDPSQTQKDLFLPPKVVPRITRIKKEKEVNTTSVIRPSMGGFVRIELNPISAAIARIKLA